MKTADIKKELLEEIFKVDKPDFKSLDSMVEFLYKSRSFTEMLNNYYIGFLYLVYDLDVKKLVVDLTEMNNYQLKEFIYDVCKDLNIDNMFLHYESVLKDMNRNYQSNAVDILESIVKDSENVMSEAFTNLGDLIANTESLKI